MDDELFIVKVVDLQEGKFNIIDQMFIENKYDAEDRAKVMAYDTFSTVLHDALYKPSKLSICRSDANNDGSQYNIYDGSRVIYKIFMFSIILINPIAPVAIYRRYRAQILNSHLYIMDQYIIGCEEISTNDPKKSFITDFSIYEKIDKIIEEK